MILDSCKLHALIVQVGYAQAFELWDRAGAIARQASRIWPGLELNTANPQEQTLRGDGLQIQTTMDKATITLHRPESLDARKVQQLADMFDIWRKELELLELSRVSTRAIYARDYASIAEANAALFALNLVRRPTERVFDQPQDAELNTVDVQYRFEDSKSFAFLRIRSERIEYKVELDPDFVSETEIRSNKSRLLIDFDRALLGTVIAAKLRMDDWLKGFQHVLRRDLEKVVGA